MSLVGFCAICQRVYERARCQREGDLARGARTLALGNPEVVGLLAENPVESERLLAHAVAHNTDRGRPGHQWIPMAAVHDYLAETMDHIAEQASPRTVC